MSIHFCRCKILSSRCSSQMLQMARRGAFFSRKDEPQMTEEDVDKALAQTDRRKYRQGEDGHLIKHNLNQLASKRILTTKKGYKPQGNIEQQIQKLTEQTCPTYTESSWPEISLDDPKLKFKVLSKLIQTFNHDIPNFKMNEMKTIQDAVDYFLTEVYETTAFEDLSRLDLPKNLHIQWEPNRFNPETDKMFGGRTAFPGQDTRVTSIKYRRKYDSIKTTKEKPGYYNHYYDY